MACTVQRSYVETATWEPFVSILTPSSDTVLSIHEQPSFETVPDKEDADKWKHEELKNMRANTLNVLLQLSRQGFDLYKRKPLSLNSVRRPLSKWHARDRPSISRYETGMSFASGREPVSLADEGTSNLFYYLFEDYVAAGPLKTAEKKLEQMVSRMVDAALNKKLTMSQTNKVLESVVGSNSSFSVKFLCNGANYYYSAPKSERRA